MSGRVFHTGQVIIDIAVLVDAIPEAGGDVFGDYAGMHLGGGYNVLVASRQAGAETVYAGTMGRGSFSDIAVKGLDRIAVAHVGATVDLDLGFCVAVTDAHAERTFISTRGAETRQPIDSFDGLGLEKDDVLYITGYSLSHQDNRGALERLAGQIGPDTCRTVFDVSPMISTIPLESLQKIGKLAPLWSVNEREASILCNRLGMAGAAEGAPEAIAAALSGSLGKVLVRVGPGGAWYADAGSVTHIPTIEVEPIDTNGAGDAHSGFLCAALARGESMSTALRWANVAGALSTTIIGPATCPTMDVIEARAASLA